MAGTARSSKFREGENGFMNVISGTVREGRLKVAYASSSRGPMASDGARRILYAVDVGRAERKPRNLEPKTAVSSKLVSLEFQCSKGKGIPCKFASSEAEIVLDLVQAGEDSKVAICLVKEYTRLPNWWYLEDYMILETSKELKTFATPKKRNKRERPESEQTDSYGTDGETAGRVATSAKFQSISQDQSAYNHWVGQMRVQLNTFAKQRNKRERPESEQADSYGTDGETAGRMATSAKFQSISQDQSAYNHWVGQMRVQLNTFAKQRNKRERPESEQTDSYSTDGETAGRMATSAKFQSISQDQSAYNHWVGIIADPDSDHPQSEETELDSDQSPRGCEEVPLVPPDVVPDQPESEETEPDSDQSPRGCEEVPLVPPDLDPDQPQSEETELDLNQPQSKETEPDSDQSPRGCEEVPLVSPDVVPDQPQSEETEPNSDQSPRGCEVVPLVPPDVVPDQPQSEETELDLHQPQSKETEPDSDQSPRGCEEVPLVPPDVVPDQPQSEETELDSDQSPRGCEEVSLVPPDLVPDQPQSEETEPDSDQSPRGCEEVSFVPPDLVPDQPESEETEPDSDQSPRRCEVVPLVPPDLVPDQSQSKEDAKGCLWSILIWFRINPRGKRSVVHPEPDPDPPTCSKEPSKISKCGCCVEFCVEIMLLFLVLVLAIALAACVARE